jgi:hypothetical protein
MRASLETELDELLMAGPPQLAAVRRTTRTDTAGLAPLSSRARAAAADTAE